MALTTSFLFVTLLITASSASLFPGDDRPFLSQHPSHYHRLRARTDCPFDTLTAQEPTIRFDSEAGQTEFWDQNNVQFECAGIAAVRNFIQPEGLLLPHYNNAPQLLYVVQGRGLLGTVIPGCPETFEYNVQSRSERKRSFMDRHQKVRRFRQGDLLALPAGLTLWFYNDGNEPLVTVAVLDTGNEANQLDQTFRHFFLAGNPEGGRQSYYRTRKEEEQGEIKNIFNGFSDDILAHVFDVDFNLIKSLKGQEDRRGRIVRAKKFEIVFPGEEQEESWESGQRSMATNGLEEETLCSVRLKENLNRPSRADIYNPRGGRISTVNIHKLPILQWLRLSAEKGFLYRNAIMTPQWNTNAHSIIYITRGRGRFQVVAQTGKAVFDGEVREGQMIIVPQNFVVVKKASEDEGMEWVSFKTNANAVSSQLAGKMSALRALPEEVLTNAYGISREDAKQLKYGREETTMFSSPYSRSRTPRAKPLENALNVIKALMN